MKNESRLLKLEALRLKVNTTKPLSVCVFGIGNTLPDGFAHGDEIILRDPGETMAELQARCTKSIPRSDLTTLNFFQPF